MFLKRLIAFLMVLLVSPTLMAQEIPESNDDIEKIIGRFAEIQAMADASSLILAYDMNCKEIEDHFEQIRDLRYLLKLNDYWYQVAMTAKKEGMIEGLDEKIVDRINSQLAVQRLVIDGDHYKNELAKTRTALSEFLDCYNEDDSPKMSYQQYKAGLHEAVAGIEMLRETENLFGENEVTKANITEFEDRMYDSDYGNFLTTIAEMKLEAYNTNNATKNWRDLLFGEDHFNEITIKLEGLNETFSEEAATKRAKQIDDFIAISEGLSDDQKTTFAEVKKLNLRAAVLNAAVRDAEELIINNSQTSSGRLQKCYLKMNEKCGSIDLNSESRLEVPTEVNVEDYKVKSDEITADDASWEKPIGWLEPKLAEHLAALAAVPKFTETELVATIDTKTTSIKARKKFKIKYTRMYVLPAGTWIGWVPADVPHGFEGINSQHVKGKKYRTFKRESGEMIIRAPKTAGKWELRMNELFSGKEIVSYPVEILPGDPPKKRKKKTSEAEKEKAKDDKVASDEKKDEKEGDK